MLAVTVLLRPPGSERLRRRGRWRELRRREPLSLGDTKRPCGPAGLHGGCTESGLIRGTRLSELMTGLGFLPWAAAIRPGRGAARPRGGGPARRRAGGSRGGRGPPIGPASACVLAWVLRLLLKWRSSGDGRVVLHPPHPALPPRQLPGGSCRELHGPPRDGSRGGTGARHAGVCVCVSAVCACAAGSTSRLLTDPGLLIDFHVKRVQSSR